MRQPSITDYVCMLENPAGVFRTLGEVEAERNIYREIALRAGNSAAVFTYPGSGRRRFLKCYVRPNPYLREIYSYIETNRPALLPDVRLLRDELYVYTLSGEEGWVDVVEGEWVEGETLDVVIARASRSGSRELLKEFAGAFDDLCRELLVQEWAHGDLKPENIVVRPGGSLALIDCDAMWIPEFAGRKAVELGTPGYRHPGRDASHFGKRIDDYSMLLISASLHALALEPELYARYNTTDNLILSPPAVVEGHSPAHNEMLGLFAQAGMAREFRMTEALASPFPEVENVGIFYSRIPAGLTNGLVPLVQNGKWGFADASGNVAITPFWDEVLEFGGGCAAVRLEQWWHIADCVGNVVAAGLEYDEMCRRRKAEIAVKV